METRPPGMIGTMARKPVAREAVLDAFESLLIEVGERAATLDAVARLAGVSKGGLLYHFPNKEAMIGAAGTAGPAARRGPCCHGRRLRRRRGSSSSPRSGLTPPGPGPSSPPPGWPKWPTRKPCGRFAAVQASLAGAAGGTWARPWPRPCSIWGTGCISMPCWPAARAELPSAPGKPPHSLASPKPTQQHGTLPHAGGGRETRLAGRETLPHVWQVSMKRSARLAGEHETSPHVWCGTTSAVAGGHFRRKCGSVWTTSAGSARLDSRKCGVWTTSPGSAGA
jgi:hypothetical protein